MIKTVGDLVEALMKREAAVLGEQSIKHTGTIGAMYEGLTQEVLRRAIPLTGPRVSVVSGFARGLDGTRSRQLDCMLVLGEGEPVPYTSSFTFPVENVVAVIEVKKTLYQSEFGDGFQNLRSLVPLQRKRPPGNSIGALRTAFEQTARQSLPDDPDAIADPVLRQLYTQLVLEVLSPARILLGYEGFKSVSALRKGLSAHLESLVGRPGGGGPSSLPDLIMTPHAAVLKANGLPYSTPIEDGRWPLLVSSSSETPARVLLEIVWSRLFNRVGGNPELFGEDLTLEALTRFVDYRYLPAAHAWEMFITEDVSDEDLNGAGTPWEPLVLDEVEHVLVHMLCKHDELDVSVPPNGAPPKEFADAVARLAAAGLIGADAGNPNLYRLLTVACGIGMLPDGRVVAGENISGRLERWVEQRTGVKPMEMLDFNRMATDDD